MLHALLAYADWGILALRLVVGIIFLIHGAPKLKAPKTMAKAMGNEGMTPVIALLGLVESAAALGLILGIFVQWSALALSVVMVGAIYMKIAKWKVPFSAMDKTGWEFDLLILAANIAILTTAVGTIGI